MRCNRTFIEDKMSNIRVFAVFKKGAFQGHESSENRISAWKAVYSRAIDDVAKTFSSKVTHEKINQAASDYAVLEVEAK